MPDSVLNPTTSTITVTYRLTFGDRLAFAAYHLPRNPFLVAIVVGFPLLITFQSVLPAMRANANQPLLARIFAFVVLELLLLLLFITIVAAIILVTMISRRNKTIYCERNLTVSDEAFATESQYGKSETRWPMVQKLARTWNHIFMYLNQESAIIVPRRAFESFAQWVAFYDFCKQKTTRPA